MFWHMLQYAGYLVVAALVGLFVGWLIWARSTAATKERFELRAREMRAELMALRQQSAAEGAELERLRAVVASGAAGATTAEPATVAVEPEATAATPEPETAGADSEPAPDTTISTLVGDAGAEGAGAERAEPDDLTAIEGIGPKFAAALVAAGITTFSALAGASEESLTAAITAAGLSFAPSLPTWARQAALLDSGDTAGFKEYTDRLVAGREVD